VTTQGLGEKQPVAPNNKPDGSDDPEGRQKNRRVEIKVKK
jgi:photosystem I P700 chlorophyll a apoprotein A2